jgi:hypothetical protein
MQNAIEIAVLYIWEYFFTKNDSIVEFCTKNLKIKKVKEVRDRPGFLEIYPVLSHDHDVNRGLNQND